MKYLLIILLSFFGLSASAQLMQTNGTPGGYLFKSLKADTLLITPTYGSDTPTIGATRYGVSTVGTQYYRISDSTFWIRSLHKWNRITGSGGGSGIQSVSGVSPINVDNTDPNNPVISYTGDTTRYFVFESPLQADNHGDTVYVYFDSTGNGDYSIAHHSFGFYLGVFLTRAQADQYYISYDSALGKFVDTGYQRTDSFFLVKNGVEFLQGVIPASAAGGISEVIADWGLLNVNDSTLKVDSFLLASRARVGEVADSIQVVNAATYVPLIRTVTPGYGLYGGGALSANIAITADTFQLATRNRLLKVIDSLVAIIATKQATGNYITALTGDVTASGPGSVAATLATVNSNVGTFTNATVTANAKGLITAISSGTAPLTAGVYQVITATAGQTAFTFTSVPTTSATYNVFINGSACPKSYYSVASNTITFSTGLTLNDVIMIQGVQ